MSEKLTTSRAFHDAVGVEDWRLRFSGAHAYFHVGSFAEAARFVAAIAEVAEVVGHFPDVDVRPEGVTVRTASGEYGALSDRDVELARQISAEARKLGIEPDPSQVQVVAIAVAQDTGPDAPRTFRPRACPLPSRDVAEPTSMSACPPIRPKHGSRLLSKLADASR